jgi:CheY-like chemotaxis protein
VPRILLLDPDPDLRELLVLVLRKLGHEALFDAAAAADGLIVDPAAPDALTAARALRAARPSLPIICVSVWPATAEASRLEPVAYLARPFTTLALAEALRLALPGTTASALPERVRRTVETA